jgi:hypothetical protein
MHSIPQLLRFAAVALSACLLTGCVTRGYKLAAKDTPPPLSLNYTNATPTAEAIPADRPMPAVAATVNTVIIYKGPGSWKNEAYWDEYVVTLSNPGNSPVTLTGATLRANSAESSECGDSPWALERIGKKWWQSNAAQQTGTYTLLGAGAVSGLGVATLSAFSGSSAAAVGFGVGAAAAVALPVVALGSVGMNLHRKHQIQAEFTRRRLKLPLTLAPGESVAGSLFFRITPSPRELVLRTQSDERTESIGVSLAPLVNLHMRLPVELTAAAR